MEEGVKAKKGYSILSRLVILTLLAVWMAIPRADHVAGDNAEMFVIFHQLAVWFLVASFLGLFMAILLIILWSPAVISVLENTTDDLADFWTKIQEGLTDVPVPEFWASGGAG